MFWSFTQTSAFAGATEKVDSYKIERQVMAAVFYYKRLITCLFTV